MDVRLVRAAVTGMDADAFTEKFLDGRCEGVNGGEREVAKRDISRLQTSFQWTGIV